MSYPFPQELHELVQEGMAMGSYASEDEVLLEAMRILRERDSREKEFRSQLQTRIGRLDRGEGIVLEGEGKLQRFFDDVQMRGMERYRDSGRAK